jgi:hypothetical protein
LQLSLPLLLLLLLQRLPLPRLLLLLLLVPLRGVVKIVQASESTQPRRRCCRVSSGAAGPGPLTVVVVVATEPQDRRNTRLCGSSGCGTCMHLVLRLREGACLLRLRLSVWVWVAAGGVAASRERRECRGRRSLLPQPLHLLQVLRAPAASSLRQRMRPGRWPSVLRARARRRKRSWQRRPRPLLPLLLLLLPGSCRRAVAASAAAAAEEAVSGVVRERQRVVAPRRLLLRRLLLQRLRPRYARFQRVRRKRGGSGKGASRGSRGGWRRAVSGGGKGQPACEPQVRLLLQQRLLPARQGARGRLLILKHGWQRPLQRPRRRSAAASRRSSRRVAASASSSSSSSNSSGSSREGSSAIDSAPVRQRPLHPQGLRRRPLRRQVTERGCETGGSAGARGATTALQERPSKLVLRLVRRRQSRRAKLLQMLLLRLRLRQCPQLWLARQLRLKLLSWVQLQLRPVANACGHR